MNLTEEFINLLDMSDSDPNAAGKAAELVLSADETPETDGLMAMMYHDGIGVTRDLDKAFRLAEKAAFEGNDSLGYYLLGFMCDNAETPDQAEGGPRQKYDHYDAERFYEKCAEMDGHWAEQAHLWLGEYFLDMARGGSPEEGIEHLEAIGEENAEAAGKLSDYYWNRIADGDEIVEDWRDPETDHEVFRWTQHAVRLDPYNYSYRMGLCYAEGIDCDREKGFRLARKYWEDAYDFGEWWAADAIAMLYEERLENLPDLPENTDRRNNLIKEIESWHRLARREEARQAATEPDPAQEED